MPQHSISLEKTDPRELFGPQDQHLRLLEQRFPETKITARGQVLKLEGPSVQIESLSSIFQEMMSMIRRNITITKQDVQTLMAVAGFTGGTQNTKTDTALASEFAEPSAKPGKTGKKVKSQTGSDSGLSEPDLDKTFFPDETTARIQVLSKDASKSTSEISSSISTTYPNGELILHTHAGEPVIAKTPGQREIVKASTQNDIVFAIGPAGTGKTFTSVALAVAALKTKQVKKIILARPAVEAGESLGFLPGALKEKIDPYLRPLYDALEEMIDHDRLEFNLARNIIEIAPLAYMRGRTLNNAFVILDEAQNATHTQMKMFLTRIGFHSRAIITGDITQTDLPKTSKSGLISIQSILQNIPGIEFVHLGKEDVVRHRLVRDIIKAYEDFEEKRAVLMPEVRPHSPSVHALREGVFSVGLDRSFIPIAPTDPPARGALKLSINPFLVQIPASDDALHEAPARNILIDAGLGEFSKGGSLDALRQNLARHGLTELDITDVLLSHLHYDHMAGLAHQENGFWELTFPDATIWANRKEAEKALAKELFYDEEKTEFLHFIANRASFELIDEGEGPFPGFRSEVIGGHTEFSLAWSFTLSFSNRQQTFLMAGDVIGSKGALLRKYAAKYDFDAEKGMQSREMLKKRALDEGLVLLAYHDVESPLMRLMNYDPKSGYDIKLLGHDFTWEDSIEGQTLDHVEEATKKRGING